MFGELLGLWAASVWKAIGSPSLLRLIELGPGRGTMMADALRALRVLPPLYQALSIHLVEINPVLRDKQKATLSGVRNIAWHDSIDDVPDGPSVILANEYFDVLPIHQVVKGETGWHERTVEIDGSGKLEFGIRPRADPAFRGAAAAAGARRSGRRRVRVAARCRDHEDRKPGPRPGRCRADHRLRPSAQRRRRYVSGHRPPQLHRPLKNPGQADVTAHVDFQALARAAEDLGARVHGPVPQGDFLKRLGIENPRDDADGQGHA
jgi:NADH dehydrogenase [ubiquinone] 1 alpha subcomplex assembly factor 7